jgi:hypothetical protein
MHGPSHWQPVAKSSTCAALMPEEYGGRCPHSEFTSEHLLSEVLRTLKEEGQGIPRCELFDPNAQRFYEQDSKISQERPNLA